MRATQGTHRVLWPIGTEVTVEDGKWSRSRSVDLECSSF